MNIKCMATSKTKTSEACLKCASEGLNTCGYDYGLLSFIFRDRQDRPDVHVTDLTGCLRKSYHQKKTPAARFPHEQLALSLGSITHGLLDRGDGESDTTEVPVDAMGVKGTADRLQFLPGGVRVVDYKTTRWLKPSSLPYGSHELQVNIYAKLLRMQGFVVHSAAIQYIDLSGPTKCRSCKLTVVPSEEGGLVCPSCGNAPGGAHLGAVLYEVKLTDDAEITELIEERRDTLRLALDMDSEPDAEPGWLCNYCSYVDICRDGTIQTGR